MIVRLKLTLRNARRPCRAGEQSVARQAIAPRGCPSPDARGRASASPHVGRGEEGSGILSLRLRSGLRLVEAELSGCALNDTSRWRARRPAPLDKECGAWKLTSRARNRALSIRSLSFQSSPRRERGRKDPGFFAAAALNDTCLERRRSRDFFFFRCFSRHPRSESGRVPNPDSGFYSLRPSE